jgi:hypothetical protein
MTGGSAWAQEVDLYYRLPHQPWIKTECSAEVSGLCHNVLGGFLDLRPPSTPLARLGHFRAFRYRPTANPPA